MNINAICTAPLSAIGSEAIEYGGSARKLRAGKILAGSEVIGRLRSVVLEFAPESSEVLLIESGDRADCYRLLCRTFRLRRYNAGAEIDPISLDSVAEMCGEVTAIVACGDESAVEAGKYIAWRTSKKLIAVPQYCAMARVLAGGSELRTSGLFTCAGEGAADAVVADYDLVAAAPEGDLPCGFGYVFYSILLAFDLRFSAIVYGDNAEAKIADCLLELGYLLLDALKGASKGQKDVPAIIADCNIRLSAIMAFAPRQAFLCGGAAKMMRAIKSLMTHEKRAVLSDGEALAVLTMSAQKIYRRFLSAGAKTGFVPPPDNNKKADAMIEFLGVSPRVAALRAVPYDDNLPLRLYRLGEYAGEISDALTEAETMCAEGYTVFKRLYRDDGFSLVGSIEPSDLAAALYFAPNMGGAGEVSSLIDLMHALGLLEKYMP